MIQKPIQFMNFQGTFGIGNPKLYHPDKINVINKKTFGDLYNKWLKKYNLLIESGFKVIYIWENVFRSNNVHPKPVI